LSASLDSATTTLGALGTLVDEAPDLLRAVATTDAVQIVLQKADRLIGGFPGSETQQSRIQILLAFADLQGFIGAAESQEKLARGALSLIRTLRTTNPEFPGIDGAEAAAHGSLGKALVLQGYAVPTKFDESLKELRLAINLLELAVAREDKEDRALKWRQRKAEAFELFATAAYNFKNDRDEALRNLRKAIEGWNELAQKEPDDPTYKQGLAWAHYNIADIESDQQNLDAASLEYDVARNLINELGDRVYRNNEWLDRKAEIYIGSALLP